MTEGRLARDPLIGRTLAERYRIEDTIARGGMARVYRARDDRLERDVAIKVLSSPYADDPAFTERFLAEARAAASLSHPSLVHVYDSGSDGASHFIVMELLDRHRSLRDEVDARGPLDRDEVLRIGRELLAGLRVVHEHGLVHCDVKSGNVMLGPGPAKLIDFGIARSPHEARAGDTSIGSLQFMSPEQLHGEALTPSSDLFSLGVVLYEALTGRLPYPGSTPEEVSAAHRAGAVRPPSATVSGVPGRLDDAIMQALRRDPASRFHSAEAMSFALGAAADEVDRSRDHDETRVIRAPASPPPPPSRGYVPPPLPAVMPTRPPRRQPPPAVRPARRTTRSGLWGVLGTFLILGIAGLVVVFGVLPLLDLGGAGGGQGGASPSATPQGAPAPGSVLVPETVGLRTADAIERATEAGLDWTVQCNEDESQPEGIVHQEPPAGTSVEPGSTFTMYSARISDCR
jgi:eukaryotic-like serine/threonine-protein kinase